jgi:hypothetical protein
MIKTLPVLGGDFSLHLVSHQEQALDLQFERNDWRFKKLQSPNKLLHIPMIVGEQV